MTSFTKKAITEAFWELLNEKPVDKITVTESSVDLAVANAVAHLP